MKKSILLFSLLLLVSCAPKNDTVLGSVKENTAVLTKLEQTETKQFKYEEAIKGCVTCFNYVKQSNPQTRTSTLVISAFGSGFIYDSDTLYYYIMTNQHVIDGCSEMHILTYYNQEISVSVVGYDAIQDVAVLKALKSSFTQEVSVLELAKDQSGNYCNPTVGEQVYAIGTPAELYFKFTLTSGVVSGVDRVVTQDDDLIFTQAHAIQTDCAINSGNSGGPLFNSKGEVIGVNALKLTDGETLELEALNFALPIHDMMAIETRIRSSVSKAITTRFGLDKVSTSSGFPGRQQATYSSERYIDLKNLTISERNEYGLSSLRQGVVMLSSNANVLDCNAYSVIIGIDGIQVDNVAQFRRILLEKTSSHKEATISYYPNVDGVLGELTTKTVTLNEVTINI